MPIPIEKGPVKFICTECGWSIIRPALRMGDCISPLELVTLRGVKKCPSCGSEEISSEEVFVLPFFNGGVEKKWNEYLRKDRGCINAGKPLFPFDRLPKNFL